MPNPEINGKHCPSSLRITDNTHHPPLPYNQHNHTKNIMFAARANQENTIQIPQTTKSLAPKTPGGKTAFHPGGGKNNENVVPLPGKSGQQQKLDRNAFLTPASGSLSSSLFYMYTPSDSVFRPSHPCSPRKQNHKRQSPTSHHQQAGYSSTPKLLQDPPHSSKNKNTCHHNYSLFRGESSGARDRIHAA